MCEALGQADQAAHTLHESAVAARQAGHLTHAMAAAHQLTAMQPATVSASQPGNPGVLAVMLDHLAFYGWPKLSL